MTTFPEDNTNLRLEADRIYNSMEIFYNEIKAVKNNPYDSMVDELYFTIMRRKRFINDITPHHEFMSYISALVNTNNFFAHLNGVLRSPNNVRMEVNMTYELIQVNNLHFVLQHKDKEYPIVTYANAVLQN